MAQTDGNGTLQVMATHLPTLDRILGGGLPLYSWSILAGKPGSGKTVLAQQILFQHLRHQPAARVLYLTTLSEPRVKVVRYSQRFSFFDAEAFGQRIVYQDIGRLVRGGGLTDKVDLLMRVVEQNQAEILVIDSFSALRDFAGGRREFRLFCYDLAERLAGARCTTLLVGEYDRADLASGAEFAVADGIFYLDLQERAGEQQRFLQVFKLRGQPADLRPCPFLIDENGVTLLHAGGAPKASGTGKPLPLPTGIGGLDAMLQGGIPTGHTVILSGISGAGKTIGATQFLCHGAERGERCLLVAFEEAPEQLHNMARSFHWDLQALQQRGLLRIVYVPQGDIRLLNHLARIVAAVEEFRPTRIVIDSFSVFLYRVDDPATQRDMTYRLCSLFRGVGAVGLLVSDITAAHPSNVSRFGVEETVADGTIVLTSSIGDFGRRRYLEVHKMRDCPHVIGRQRMTIGASGVRVLYQQPPPLVEKDPLPLVSPVLQSITRSKLRHGSAWLVRGDAGAGKTSLAGQFALEGVARGECVLYLATDSPPYLVRHALRQLGCAVDDAEKAGLLSILDVAGTAEGLDPRDPEVLLYTLLHRVGTAPRPLRLIIDSLWPLASALKAHEFVDLIQRKNLLLRRPDVTLFDTKLTGTLDAVHSSRLLNTYDTVLELSRPHGGNGAGSPPRMVRVVKVRGVDADLRPQPYTVSPAQGVQVESRDYDRREEEAR